MTTTHSALADFLDQRREQITTEWLLRVRRDRQIPSADDLPREELIDHMPFLLTALIERLRGTPYALRETEHQSQVHGETRANQNYRLPELLREVSILRNVLIELWVEFDLATGPDRHLQLESSTILHAILDGVIAESTTGFVDRQQKELVELNRTLEAANERTQAVNAQLNALDERRLRTLRTITHEIANHLNAAGLMLSLVQRAPAGVDAPTATASIARSITAMTTLMKQLLEFSTLAAAEESATLKPLAVGPFFEELASFARSLATEKGLTFTAELSPELDTISTDASLLRRVGMNLLSNAVKYTPDGSVRLAFRPRDADTWLLEVSDTGCGVEPAERDRIFEEFYRSEAVRETSDGVGLGLAITRQLASLLGGTIELESEPGAGSIFRAVLPR